MAGFLLPMSFEYVVINATQRKGGLMNDVDDLRRDVSLVETASFYGVELQKNGLEYEGLCPFHVEDTPSFTIFSGKDHIWRFHCFGCGERGDVLDFVKKIQSVDLPGAITLLKGGEAGPNVRPVKIEARDIYAGIKLLTPQKGIAVGQRVSIWNPKRGKFGSFAPSMVFPYYKADGSALGYVLRHDLPNGEKETPMVCWVELPDGKECWSRFPFPKPRPLYGAKNLHDGQVIVVEGEKCRDAMNKNGWSRAVSWPGGTHGVKHTDWMPLANRSVVICPDADRPGKETAKNIADTLLKMGCAVKILDISERLE